jgi:hypothetical protein
MARRGPAHPERSFGISVGAVAVLAGLYLWWRGSVQMAAVLGTTGVMLAGLGLTAPRALYRPSRLWWRLAHLLGYINARIILTVLFAVLLVPLGLFWRLTGKDPLGRRRDRWPGWSPYPARYRDPKHYSRMY